LGWAEAHFLAQIDAARLLHFRGMPTRPLAGVTLVALLSLTVTACGGGDELDSRSASLGLAQPTNAFGLTFGQALGETPPGTIAMSCHGAPKGVENPHAGSCNPYAGDTRCDHALPILCIKRDARPAPPGFTSSFYNGWVHGELASSAPVVGRALTSRAVAERIGVKQRLVYYYFRTMDELIVETFRRLAIREKERMSKALAHDLPLREIWEVCVRTTDTRLVSEFMALANRIGPDVHMPDLATDPGSARDRSLALDELGAVAQAQGDWAQAEAAYRESLQLRRSLLTREPNSRRAQESLLHVLEKVVQLPVSDAPQLLAEAAALRAQIKLHSRTSASG